MLKLVRTLPKVFKYLPSNKAQDARTSPHLEFTVLAWCFRRFRTMELRVELGFNPSVSIGGRFARGRGFVGLIYNLEAFKRQEGAETGETLLRVMVAGG